MQRNLSKLCHAEGEANGDPTILQVTLKLWLDRSQNQNEVIEELLRSVRKIGRIKEIKSAEETPACRTCGWIHDSTFTQTIINQNKAIFLGGVLPDIVAVVHRAHEKGLPALSTKDAELLAICGGYGHPSKAFDDLNHADDYKALFHRRRGFISLRRASGTHPESKSETNSE